MRKKKLIVALQFSITDEEYPYLLEIAYGMTFARTGKGEFVVLDISKHKGFKIAQELHPDGMYLVLRDFVLKKKDCVLSWIKTQRLPCFIINPGNCLSKKLTDYYQYDIMRVHVTMSRDQFMREHNTSARHDENKIRKALFKFRRSALTELGRSSLNRRKHG